MDIIDEDPAWSITYDGAVGDMETVDCEMGVLAPGMVEAVGAGELCEEWAGDMGEGMEKESIYTYYCVVDKTGGT